MRDAVYWALEPGGCLQSLGGGELYLYFHTGGPHCHRISRGHGGRRMGSAGIWRQDHGHRGTFRAVGHWESQGHQRRAAAASGRASRYLYGQPEALQAEKGAHTERRSHFFRVGFLPVRQWHCEAVHGR